jgi:hypothetical protein
MDQKGFLATADAIFGLLIIFILISAVLNVTNSPMPSFSQEITPEQDVQDLMEILATNSAYGDNQTILMEITIQLLSQNNSNDAVESSGIIVSDFLNNTAPGMKYNFTETQQLNGTTIAANEKMENAKNIHSAIRHFGNYTFQLYLWK